MKTTKKELVMPGLGVAAAPGMFVLTTSCTATFNPGAQTQRVRDSSKVATTIKIDGSSTVYPITQAAV